MANSKAFKIVVASDHAGFDMKSVLKKHLEDVGHNVLDVGTHSIDRTDYPDHAHSAANAISNGTCDLGILVCGSGNGVQMTANKHENVRCGLAWTEEIAALARQHNDANMIAIPARFIEKSLAIAIVNAFVGAEFEGGRHATRVNKIALATKETS